MGSATGAEIWRKEEDLVNIDEVHKSLISPISKYHDPSLKAVEQELLDHYKDFLHFVNHVCAKEPDAGKKYYELLDTTDFDLMGTLHRPAFDAHYDHITPYLANASVAFKDLEVFAVTPEFGYVTCVQWFTGTASDGVDFDFRFRATSILRKITGEWKYVHEHFSFPVNMATKIADTTCGQALTESVEFGSKS